MPRSLGVTIVVFAAALATTATVETLPAPFHADGPALERALLDATLAFARGDSGQVRQSLDRVEAACRRAQRDENPPVPSEVLAWDRGFHITLDESREFASRGEIERAFDKFAWIQRACRSCHDQAVKDGIRPPPR